MKKWKSSFTLIELMIVVAIIMLLISILMPALKKVNNRGKKLQCGNNLRQLGVAFNFYLNDYSIFPTPYMLGADKFKSKACYAVYSGFIRTYLPITGEMRANYGKGVTCCYYCPSRRIFTDVTKITNYGYNIEIGHVSEKGARIENQKYPSEPCCYATERILIPRFQKDFPGMLRHPEPTS